MSVKEVLVRMSYSVKKLSTSIAGGGGAMEYFGEFGVCNIFERFTGVWKPLGRGYST